MKMRYGQNPLFTVNTLLFCLIIGVLAAEFLHIPAAVFLGAAFFLVIGGIYALEQKSAFALLLLGLLFLCVGFCRYTIFAQLPADNISNFIGESKSITGIVQSQPVVLKNADGVFSMRYELKALSSKDGAVSGGYYLYTHEEKPADVEIGDAVTAFGKIRKINTYKNPGRINNALQARINGIYASLTAGKAPLNIQKRPDNMRILKKIAQLRTNIKASMEKVMPDTDAAAVFAMLFGGYAGIDSDLLESFTTTGIVHILSVSGSHITLLAGTIITIGKFCRMRRDINIIILIICISVYAVFCGLVPPVVRSAAMGIISYTAFIFGRESQSRYLLSLVGIIMLLISPELVFNISFQLSFAATAGLLYTSSFFRRKLAFLPRFLSLSLAITLGAQFFCLPFLSWYFHSVSLSSLAANIIAVPLVDAIIIAALAAVFINAVAPPFAAVIFVACSLLLGSVHEITRILSYLPGSSVYLPYLTVPGSIIYYFCWYVLLNEYAYKICRTKIHDHKKIIAACSFIVITALLYNQFHAHDLAVHFIDVGQGDAALIITPHGKAVMIDTGGTREGDFDIGKSVDVPYLYHYGVRHLDGIFLSHADADHAAGTSGVNKQIPAAKILVGHEKLSDYAHVWHISPQSDIMSKVTAVNENEIFTIDGVEFTVLYASRNSSDTNNENSVVIKMNYKNFSVLFTGDLPAQREAELLQKHKDIAASVLKVAHHGSKTSSSAEFLAKAQPRWAVISVGEGNSYGHPTKEVLARLNNINAQIYRTDKNGAVTFYTDGEKCTVRPYLD